MKQLLLVICLALMSFSAWGQFAVGINMDSFESLHCTPSSDMISYTTSEKLYYADKAESFKKYAQYALCSIPVTALVGAGIFSIIGRPTSEETDDTVNNESGNVSGAIGMATGIATSLLVSGALYCVGLSYEHRINNPRYKDRVNKYRQELALSITPQGITLYF